MAKHTDGKLKILYVKDILERARSVGQPVTMRDILEQLAARGIPAERKSVSDDLRLLQQYGLPLLCVRRGRASAYTLEAPEKKP